MIEELRKRARELLEKGEVAVIIGYGQGDSPPETFPLFVSNPGEVDHLIFNPFCTNNLALYLVRKEVSLLGRPGLAARPEEIRTVSVLVQESQVKPEDVVLIGVFCSEPGKEGAPCGMLEGKTLEELEKEVRERFKGRDLSGEELARVRELEALPPEERWVFWEGEFSRCIKCYACRQACPLCYCERCIVEKNQPQWIPSSSHALGNYSWNLVRAFHLAGRCVSCGACERACPMNIPLSLLNKKMALEVRENFGYESGYDHKAPLPMASFLVEDSEEFIK